MFMLSREARRKSRPARPIPAFSQQSGNAA